MLKPIFILLFFRKSCVGDMFIEEIVSQFERAGLIARNQKPVVSTALPRQYACVYNRSEIQSRFSCKAMILMFCQTRKEGAAALRKCGGLHGLSERHLDFLCSREAPCVFLA